MYSRSRKVSFVPKTIVITGASDGVGAAAARRLSAEGHQVVLVGRSPEKTAAVGRELDAPFYLADFADLAQVRNLAAELGAAYPSIDVLANNAGGIFGDRGVTVDGFEQTFQVNHLAGFLLTNLLMENLAAGGASVIQTSSVAAQRFAKFDIDDLQGEKAYSGGAAYGNAKLANILFTRELQVRFHDREISSAAFHPGVVASGFASASGGLFQFFYSNPLSKRFMTSTDEGGARLVFFVDGVPGKDWVSGGYYERDSLARANPLAADPVLSARFWDMSAQLVGL